MARKSKRTGKINIKWVTIVVVVLVLAGVIMGYRWASYARPPLPEALEALESDSLVTVTQGDWLTFSPTGNPINTGFVFYPGGRVDPRGYASLMREIASRGYLVVVPTMPFNIAAFNPNAADLVIQSHPEIHQWVIGGHSVGGTMAAQYTSKHPDVINGLAIWASYPADSTDLSGLDIPVVSIYGSREIRVNDESVGERAHLLPPDTQYIRIEGGDHHQFGSYEIPPEDHLATVDRASQHQQILQATLEILERVANP